MIIGICGAPGCGKTAVGMLLSHALHAGGRKKVIFLSPDQTVPAAGLLFPSRRRQDTGSLGEALDRTDIGEEDIVRQLTFPEGRRDLAVLGYRTGECAFTYPAVTADKAERLLEILEKIADYTVAEITCGHEEKIGALVRASCPALVRLRGPDVRGAVYDASAAGMYRRREDAEIGVMNIDLPDEFLPSDDALRCAGDISVTLPYSKELRERYMCGTLASGACGGAFGEAMRKLCGEVLSHGDV